MQQQKRDWIEYIADQVYEHYRGRKVVLWGKYIESDNIKNKLEEKYQIEIAFFVDSDNVKVDNRQVFSTDCLNGKASDYYVVVPLAFYYSVKELLTTYGYRPEMDYYYFSDCVIYQDEDYYEDAHGNKIFGRYAGMKFVFSGFESVIEIGENVKLHEMSCYVHSNSKIMIGNGVKLLETSCYIGNDSQIVVKDDAQLDKAYIRAENMTNTVLGTGVDILGCNIQIQDRAKYEIGAWCKINYLSMLLKKCAEVLINERFEHSAREGMPSIWSLLENAKLEIGCNGKFKYGVLHIEENAVIRIGKEFSVQMNYCFAIGKDTMAVVGDEGMFSYGVTLQSHDGHSIFDVGTGENMNSTCEMRKRRKIIIGNHVWVGMKATILYNTQIADGSIVGAMSLVKGKIPNNCTVAGIPARIIRRNVAWSKENGSENILDCGQNYIHLTEESQIDSYTAD